MLVQKRIQQEVTAEISCRLNHKSGNYDKAILNISYIQADGKGELEMDDGTFSLLTTFMS